MSPVFPAGNWVPGCPPAGGDGGVLFPCRKKVPSRGSPLENPLNVGVLFALRRYPGWFCFNPFVGAPVFCVYPLVLLASGRCGAASGQWCASATAGPVVGRRAMMAPMRTTARHAPAGADIIGPLPLTPAAKKEAKYENFLLPNRLDCGMILTEVLPPFGGGKFHGPAQWAGPERTNHEP